MTYVADASRRVRHVAVWTAAVLLALIGLAAAIGRGTATVQLLRLPADSRTEISRYDSAALVLAAPLYGTRPGTAKHQQIEADSRRMVRKFGDYPGTTLAHVLPAALFLILAPLQFSRPLRSRHPRLHRWSGRLLVAIAIPIGLTGLFFGMFMPFAGLLEGSAITLTGALFLYALTRAVIAIRRREIASHREWMIRVFAIALGVSVVRLVGLAFVLITHDNPAVWFAHSVWIGFLLTLIVAELWIRSTRPEGVGTPMLRTASR